MMSNDMLRKVALQIQKQLLDFGITIQRYDSISSHSIYLKFDYGVLNSVRISDHRGKRKLKYRYNIGPNIEEKYVSKEIYDRYYYPIEDVDDLINKILHDREMKIMQYGETLYYRFMENNKNQNKETKGFWQNCILIKPK